MINFWSHRRSIPGTMCIVSVKTRIHSDGRRDIIEERQYCDSASASRLCDCVDQRDLAAERIALVEQAPRPVATSRRSTTDRASSQPRIAALEDRITLRPRSSRTINTSDERCDRRTAVMHDTSRHLLRDRESIYEVLPEAPSPPRNNIEATICYTNYKTAVPREDSLSVHISENETWPTQSHTPESSPSHRMTSILNRSARIDAAYAPPEHIKSPSPPRSVSTSRMHRSRHREVQNLDDRLPSETVTPERSERNTTATSSRLRDIEADFERAQADTEKMNHALRYMSFSDGKDYGIRHSSS